MSEFTLSLTTMKPETTPMTPQVSTTMMAMIPIGSLVCSVSQFISTIVSDIISPIDRSKVSAVSGTRNASASTAVTAPSENTTWKVLTVRNRWNCRHAEQDEEDDPQVDGAETSQAWQPEMTRAGLPWWPA